MIWSGVEIDEAHEPVLRAMVESGLPWVSEHTGLDRTLVLRIWLAITKWTENGRMLKAVEEAHPENPEMSDGYSEEELDAERVRVKEIVLEEIRRAMAAGELDQALHDWFRRSAGGH